ncbi:MAG: alpha/beta fold hydrolase [Ginsengibacter sp.]
MKSSEKLMLRYLRTKFKLLSTISEKKAAKEAFKLFCTPLISPFKQPASIFDTAEFLTLNLNNNILKGYRWNYPSEKKILLLHGFSSSAKNFHHFVTPLIQKGYEVMAFDAPAHGISEGTTINALDYTDMIKKIIELFGPIKNFIAHSFGGLAVCLAIEEIKHDESTKVVLIAPATETTSAVDHAFKLLKIKNNAVRKEFNKIIYSINGKPAEWYSVKRALKNIQAKIIWIHDRDDDTTPFKDVENAMKEKFKNVEFQITRGLGHSRIYRDSQIVGLVIDFFK